MAQSGYVETIWYELRLGSAEGYKMPPTLLGKDPESKHFGHPIATHTYVTPTPGRDKILVDDRLLFTKINLYT